MLYIPDLQRTQPFANENAQKGASHRPSIRAKFLELRKAEIQSRRKPLLRGSADNG
jgi:hypothetical protein